MVINMQYNDLSYEKLSEKIYVCISTEHRFGTDAFLLADFAKARHKDKAADFCSGNGIAALLLERDYSPKRIYALEIQKKAYDQLCLSVEKSETAGEIIPVLGDLKDFKSKEELDLIICNPPYKADGAGIKNDTESSSIARHEMLCNIDDVCLSASRNLKFGGRLCVCNRPERLCDIMVAMRKNNLEPKRARFVSKNKDTSPWLVLVEGKKGSKPFMRVEPQFYTQSEDGAGFSDELKALYSLYENTEDKNENIGN